MSKSKKFFAGLSLFGSVLFLGLHSVALAAGTLVAPVSDEQDLEKLFCSIIAWFFWILIVISVIMVLVAAFDYITAGDDAEKTSRGRKRLTYAAIGIAIALIAAGFPSIVASVFPNEPGTSLSDTCPGIGG